MLSEPLRADEGLDERTQLVERAQQGDRVAFEELYRLHSRAVHGILLARVSGTDVEDLVQDVFLLAWQRLASLHDPLAFAGWLMTIARHRATDHLRASAVVRATEISDPGGPDRRRQGFGESAGALAKAERAALHVRHRSRDGYRPEALAALAVLRSLPIAYRETLALRLIEGMSGAEIAARTGLTEGSVRVNLHRGMKLLRERLEGGLP